MIRNLAGAYAEKAKKRMPFTNYFELLRKNTLQEKQCPFMT